MFGKGKKSKAINDADAKVYTLKGTKKTKRKKRSSVIIMILVLLLLILAAMVGFFTDWLWFKSLGYQSVFVKKLLTELQLGIPVFIIAALLIRIYLSSLKKGYFKKVESHEIPNARSLNAISWVLALASGVAAAIVCSRGVWMDFLKFVNSTPFNLKDPIFNLDVSFYIFRLAFLTKLNNIVLALIVGLVIVTLLYYAILITVRTPDVWKREGSSWTADEDEDFAGSEDEPENATSFAAARKKFERQQARNNPKRTLDINEGNIQKLLDIASFKLMILGVLFYLMVAINFALKQFDLLHTHTGVVYGAGFTDINVTLWLYRIIMGLALIGAITFMIHMRGKKLLRLVRMPIIIVVVGVLGTLVGTGVQNLIVSPDEINKESKYLENNITFTRHAYGIDDVDVEEFPANNSLTAQDIANNKATISNIRINDYEPVQDFYNQTQSIRQYYDFNDVDIDRYTINGNETQTYLAPREINETRISDTWINRHLKYTHGYGITLSQVDAVTASGQPDVIVKNIPPESRVDDIKITRPEIYFGELTNEYIIVNTDEPEFDYPDGTENKYTMYEGTAGIQLNLLNRLLFSMKEGSMKLLVSSNVNSDSRIITDRNIMTRVRKIMPYLTYEGDPYMTIVDGKLYWIIDAYTTSSYYPYSEPYSAEVNTTNYIRNSIKVIIDAYNGDVDFYIVDSEDPIAETFKKIYPKLFKPIDDMPAGLQEHIRYPEFMFKIQADVYKKYHMTEVKVFYLKEDLWDLANQIYGMEEKAMTPSYFIFKLPDETEAEFINMIPFTPMSKQNMTAIMMARNDGEHYGEIKVYTMPKNKTVYGPMQIEAQVDQNTEISKELSLWNSAGSNYRRGNMFVIPIEDSIMYVEPIYLEASNQAIPEVKRVIVAYGDRIAYKPTLSEALEEMFGEGYESIVPTEEQEQQGQSGSGESEGSGGSAPMSQTEMIQKANEAYEKAVQAQKNGDWKAYGEHLAELEKYLKQLESASGIAAQPEAPTTPTSEDANTGANQGAETPADADAEANEGAEAPADANAAADDAA